MEVYKSVYDLMLAKAISYGYVKQQVLDILSESHDRVELSTFKNIPNGEKYWMAERWTWETLCFCRRVGRISRQETKVEEGVEVFKAKLTRGGRNTEKHQVKANDSTASPKLKLRYFPAARPQNLGDNPTEKSSGEKVPKPATRLPPTSPTSSPSERESKKRQKLTQPSDIADEKDLKLPGEVSTTVSSLTDAKRQKKPTYRTNRIPVTDAQEPQCSSALQETISKT